LTRGKKVVAFIEAFCLIPEGQYVGQPMKLLPFQKKFILDVYDNPSGTSRAYLSVARKNGKSALIAAILLAHIVGPEAKQNSQIVSGARSREQAALVFKLAEKMVRLSPQLSEIVRVVPSSKMLIGLVMNVEYKAISAEAGTAHGLSPVLAILDEVGQVRGPQDSFIEAIETAQGAHLSPLLIAISTQAATDADLFSNWLDDAANAKDRRIVSHVYTAPEDCALNDRKSWRAANPALGKFRSLQDMADFARQAARLPAKENSFRWLYLNQRIEAVSPFLSKSEWEANSAAADVPLGSPCWAGLDLSASRDLTALVLVFPVDDKFHVVPHFFLPAQGIRERSQSEKYPYDTWAKQGFLTLIDGPVIIPSVIARAIAEVSHDYDLQLLSYDRWRINDIVRELDNIGILAQTYDGNSFQKQSGVLPVAPFGQGFKDMAPAVDKLERLVAQRNLCHGGNPILNMCAAGAVIEQDPAGNRKLTKKKSLSRIDGLVALAMALGNVANETDVEATSPWDDPDYRLAG
tara:strand:- start:6 stop:1565 length:1560 start_codon:yes stop_codon:yes gene_type:complete